jgi:hypothetical protein
LKLKQNSSTLQKAYNNPGVVDVNSEVLGLALATSGANPTN